VVIAFALFMARPAHAELPFLIGADLSWIKEREASGRRFFDGGVQKDPLVLFKEHGFNSVRLRLFHNPQSSGGYNSRGFCGWDSTLAMARRVKAAGFGIFLDFHYSDTWADPEHQKPPAAWAGLPLSALEDSVTNYTTAFIQAMKAQGTPPFMVQIGNEVNPGFLLPTGSTQTPESFGRLFAAGARAVRSVDPGIRIVLHLAAGNDAGLVRWVLKGMGVGEAGSPAAEIDVIGLSCYTEFHGTPTEWKATFEALLKEYPQYEYLIAEYSHEKAAAHAVMADLPNRKGLGAYIWEPMEWMESVFTWSSGNNWNSNALLDLYPGLETLYNPGRAIPVGLVVRKEGRGRLRPFLSGFTRDVLGRREGLKTLP
jgi:arabinogalactan endo-1,4-beta-galactosidase